MISNGLIDFKTVLECIRDPNLHLSLRAAYLEFIISSVVDRCAQEFGMEIAHMWHTFVSVVQYPYIATCVVAILFWVHQSLHRVLLHSLY